MAHLYSLATAMQMIQFTTRKYEKLSPLPAEQMCFRYSVELFHNLISKLYLNDMNFNPNTRSDIEDMIKLVKDSFGQLIDENDWMDPATKKIAKEKLLAIQSHVAAPDIVFNEEILEKDNAQVSCNHFYTL